MLEAKGLMVFYENMLASTMSRYNVRAPDRGVFGRTAQEVT